MFVNLVVVDMAVGTWKFIHLRRLYPAALRQAFQAYQQRIAGKGRGRRVRRVAVRGRSQRQYLPEPLACGCKKIEKLVGSWAETTDAASGRQRDGVKQY